MTNEQLEQRIAAMEAKLKQMSSGFEQLSLALKSSIESKRALTAEIRGYIGKPERPETIQ